MTVTEFLRDKVPFLAGLAHEEVHRLARAAEQLQCRRGQDLLALGTPLPGLLVVATGRLGGTGAGLGPGDVFGAACLLGPANSAAALRVEQDSLVFVIPATAFAGLLERLPELRERARGADGGADPAPLERFTTRFELRRLVAQGGMGAVFEAFDPGLQRVVAIKRLRPELRLDPGAAAKFLEEARIVAGLRHPNIVEIFSVVEEPAELLLVFEFIDGKTLAELIQERGRLELGECRRILRMAASAVSHAHACKILHQDLKPGNIMITREGLAKVMDFGVARKAKETISRMSRTQPLGTLAYAAPEQHLGEGRRQADVYSLAATLYRMLAGELPFPGPDYLGQKEKGAFVPPSERVGGLPPVADAFMARALAPRPQDRFETVGDFMASFEDAFGDA